MRLEGSSLLTFSPVFFFFLVFFFFFFDGSRSLRDFHLAWLEPWIAMTGDPVAEAIAKPRRALRYSKLGGDQTLIWAR